jgi:hypothetical protein
MYFFDHFYAAISTIELTFKSTWANTTGYYDKLVGDDIVPGDFGTVARFYDASTRRRGLVLKTRFGNAVVFERYADSAREILVKNIPLEMEQMLYPMSGAVTEDMFLRIFSDDVQNGNFATRFEYMLKHVNNGTATLPPYQKRKLDKAERETMRTQVA